MADREQLVMPIDTLSMPTISIGNTVDSALPVLTTEFTQPQLMPRAHVLASLDELGKRAGNKALRQLEGTILGQNFLERIGLAKKEVKSALYANKKSAGHFSEVKRFGNVFRFRCILTQVSPAKHATEIPLQLKSIG